MKKPHVSQKLKKFLFLFIPGSLLASWVLSQKQDNSHSALEQVMLLDQKIPTADGVGRIPIADFEKPQDIAVEIPSSMRRRPDAEELLDLASQYLSEGNASEAIASLKVLLATQPNHSAALSELAFITLDYQNDPETAQRWMQQAISADPRDPLQVSALIEICRLNGSLDEGLEFLKNEYSGINDAPAATAFVANQLVQMGRHSEAATLIEENGLKAVEVPSLITQLGQAYAREGNSNKAIAYHELAWKAYRQQYRENSRLDPALVLALQKEAEASREFLFDAYSERGDEATAELSDQSAQAWP